MPHHCICHIDCVCDCIKKFSMYPSVDISLGRMRTYGAFAALRICELWIHDSFAETI